MEIRINKNIKISIMTFLKRPFILVGLLLFIFCFNISLSAQKIVWSDKDRKLIFDQLAESRKELLKTVAPLNKEQFYFRLDSNSWSANDIVEHLALMEEGYVREFWWALAQPDMPDSYRDSTLKGDEIAENYATAESKSVARGTNVPLNRYCDKETCLKIFNYTRDLSIEFFTINKNRDMRGYYVFRKSAKGVRDIRDLHQQALWLISHTVRHTNQLKRYIENPRFPK